MADPEFGPAVAESSVTDDHPMGADPRLYSDDGHEPSPVWAASQRLREVVERREALPPGADRQLLVTETQRQLTTLGLFREVVRLFTGPLDPRTTVTLFVLLFPGEGKDNTGTKDLNDKILGYRLNSEFIAARQAEIRAVFPPPDDRTGPRYVTVGQDYKTAAILAVQKTPEEFAKDLVQLDKQLRLRLLEFVVRAEKDPDTDPKKLPDIRTLRDTLRRNEKYRFDFLFGTNTLGIRGRAIDVTFQLLTEALKGAGLARYAAKGTSLSRGVSRDMAQRRGIEAPAKGQDSRGRVFRPEVFLKVLKTADDIRDLMSKGSNRDKPLDFRAIYVDTVWTTTFVLYRRLFFANPDVVRDARKKLLEPPPLESGVKFTFTSQKELVELFLVTLNMIDFVKEFASPEYPRHVEEYHVEALLILEQLLKPTEPIEWSRLARFLTHDTRQGFEPVAIQGLASEFQFYSAASDNVDQMFFAMDIRDLGVELMGFYEASQLVIQDDKLAGIPLMRETFRATDPIAARRRFTYDSVVAVFKKHYGAARAAGSRAEALKAFGGTLRTDGVMPEFRQSLQVMLGGDEVFVAAHPYYARVEHLIIADLARITFQRAPLNMRTGVAYSAADRAPGPDGPDIDPGQRALNQKAHDKALKLATDSLSELKPLERTQRRIERLIDMLEGNAKKKDLAPAHRKRLAELHLLELYTRVQHKYARQLTPAVYRRLHRFLLAADLPGAVGTKLFELVDHGGNTVDAVALSKQTAALEAAVRRDVGKDNIHIDGPPVTKIPRVIQEIIDFFLPKEKIPLEDEEKLARAGSPARGGRG